MSHYVTFSVSHFISTIKGNIKNKCLEMIKYLLEILCQVISALDALYPVTNITLISELPLFSHFIDEDTRAQTI